MSKFCGKCGSMLDEKTGLCKNCDKPVKKKKTKLVVAILCLVLIAAVAVGAVVYFDLLPFGKDDAGDTPAVSQQSTQAQTTPTEEPTVAVKQEFVHDKSVVDCGDSVVYADQNGVWVYKDDADEAEQLHSCKAMNVASDGEIVYYGCYNKSVDSDYGERYQYDLYSINIDGTDNKKVLSFVGDGEPICEVDGTVYYVDYDPDYYDESPAGLSKSLYAYDIANKEKERISKNADTVRFNDGKIYFMDIIVTGNPKVVYCYDIETDKITPMTDECVASWEIDDNKLIYVSINGMFAYTDISMIDLETSDKQTLILADNSRRLHNVQGYYLSADTIVYCADVNGSYKYYVYDVATDTETEIRVKDSQTFYTVISIDGEFLLCENVYSDDALHLYYYDEQSGKADRMVLQCYGYNIMGACDSRIYVMSGENYYLYDVDVYDVNI